MLTGDYDGSDRDYFFQEVRSNWGVAKERAPMAPVLVYSIMQARPRHPATPIELARNIAGTNKSSHYGNFDLYSQSLSCGVLMRVVGKRRLEDFCGNHADSRKWIENWVADTERAAWKTPQHIKDRYASLSVLSNNVIIFNVKGNEYRLEAMVAFNTGTVIVRWVGTHAEYDKRNRRK